MAPCYNYSTRNLHYRTQSLPEAVYNNAAMLQHLGQAEYHAQDKLHAMALHHQHTQAAITKKKVSLKRSQTNACDLVLPSQRNYHSQQHAHRPAPLTAGVYEAFLPPPNLNAIGLPINGSAGSGYHQTSRAHSFYMPSNVSTQSSSNLNLMGSQHNLCSSTSMAGSRTTEHLLASSSYHSGLPGKTFSNQLQAPRSARNLSDQATSIHTDNKYAMPFHLYHHRSVPNISAPQPQSLPPSMPAASPHSSLTTPLFVDCSVEYDLGDHPPVPANSEPLLTIHPEYVIKSSRKLNSSPYSLHPQNTNHIRGSKIKGVSPRIDINETPLKSCVAAGGDLQNLVNSSSSVRRQLLPPHHLQAAAGQQAASRYSIATRRAQQQQAAVHQYQLEQQKQLQQLHHSGGGSNGNNSMSVKLANTGVFSDGGGSSHQGDLMSAPSSSFSNCGKLDAMRKLSVESWDSGIGLMTSSAAATGGYTTTATASNGSVGGDCSQWQTQQQHQHGANSESCDNNSSMAANHFQPPPSYSYSSSALAAAAGGCGSHYQRSLPHHHSELISSTGKNINNNNSSNNKKFAFSGEYYWNCFLFC